MYEMSQLSSILIDKWIFFLLGVISNSSQKTHGKTVPRERFALSFRELSDNTYLVINGYSL